MAANDATPPPGPGVDARGVPVVDPTRNVLDLVTAAIQRQDDLRQVELRNLRSHVKSSAKHLRELVKLRADYDNQLRVSESNRIDAIRAVDVGNVSRAAEVSAAAASALAASVTASAEALRVQVEATRITTADQLETALGPIRITLESLRQTQFQQQGERSAQSESRETRGEGRANNQVLIAAAVLAVLIFAPLLSFLLAHFH